MALLWNLPTEISKTTRLKLEGNYAKYQHFVDFPVSASRPSILRMVSGASEIETGDDVTGRHSMSYAL